MFGIPTGGKVNHNSTAFFIGYNLLNGFTHTGIDNGAYIGGLLGGLVMGFLLARPLEAAARNNEITKRLAGASAVGVLALGLMSYPLLHLSEGAQQELRFRKELVAFAPQEQKVVEATKRFQQQVSDRKLQGMAVAQALEQDIVPKWNAMERSITNASLSEQSKHYPLRQALLRYIDDRRKSCQLIAMAVRQNDQSLIEQANIVKKDANSQIEIIKKLMANY